MPLFPLPLQGLVDVDLCGNNITIEGAKALAQGITVSPSLAAVALDNNDLREEGARTLLQVRRLSGWKLVVGENGWGWHALVITMQLRCGRSRGVEQRWNCVMRMT